MLPLFRAVCYTSGMAIEHGEAARAGDEWQKHRYATMSPSEKLRVATRLYWSARRLKEAQIRSLHPHLDDREVRRRVNEAFLSARD
jgi:hypothetical protein